MLVGWFVIVVAVTSDCSCLVSAVVVVEELGIARYCDETKPSVVLYRTGVQPLVVVQLSTSTVAPRGMRSSERLDVVGA